MALLNGLASALESYRGRDRLIRTLGYCCQLIGGVLVEQCPTRSEVGRRLLVVSAQLSHCRTVLRLFDDLAMFVYTKQYGLGTEEEDIFIRWLSVLSNMADQLYYPCEHIAWAADAKVLQVDSARWWTLSTALWALSLLLGAVKACLVLNRKRWFGSQQPSASVALLSPLLNPPPWDYWSVQDHAQLAMALWTMLKLRQKLRSPTGTFASQLPRSKRRTVEARICSEVLTLLSNLADLANAVHWLPRGVLWAGRFPPWLVGLMGTISSILSMYQAARAGRQAEADSP